jgi:hypothetical protein
VSGKDVIAGKLSLYVQREFKSTLKWLSQIIGQIPKPEFDQRYNDRSLKDEPWDRLNGMSLRDLMIFVSEDVMKVVHGPEFFGRVAAQSICAGADYVFSDGGFKEEIQAVIDATKETHEVHVIHLYRHDCTFEGDSRNYVKGLEGCMTHRVWNHDGLLDQTVDNITLLVNTKGYTE